MAKAVADIYSENKKIILRHIIDKSVLSDNK